MTGSAGRLRAGLLAVLVCLPSALAFADDTPGAWTASGSVALELRWFPEEPAFAGQFDGGQPSVLFEPEWRWRSAERRHQVDVAAFGRWDGRDSGRSHLDLREGSYRYVGDGFELLAGVSRVFWGVTESRHLVDVINQTDAVEDIDEEDKLGQPMVRLAVDRDWGRLELFALLGFRGRTFPGTDGRLRPPLPIADRGRSPTGDEVTQGEIDWNELDWALRWSHALGNWDLGAHLFTGVGREPRLAAAIDGRELVPLYDETRQAGIDLQYTHEAWLWKLEALVRERRGGPSYPGDTFGAAVIGVERTFYQLGGSALDLGVLVELHRDDRDATSPPTIFDRDTFAGARLALNDVQDTQLLTGVLVDHGDRSTALFVEGARRLGARITLELEARLFAASSAAGHSAASDLAAIARDDFVTVRAAWHW